MGHKLQICVSLGAVRIWHITSQRLHAVAASTEARAGTKPPKSHCRLCGATAAIV